VCVCVRAHARSISVHAYMCSVYLAAIHIRISRRRESKRHRILNMYTHMLACIHTYIHTYRTPYSEYVHTHACMHAYIHHTYIHMHACIHTYIHMYIHTYVVQEDVNQSDTVF